MGACAALTQFACNREPTPTPLAVEARPGPTASAGAADEFGQLTPELADKVLARVGERNITLGDYAAALQRMDRFDRLRYQTKERRRQLLEAMIDLELLAGEAERQGLHQLPETQELLRQFLRDEVLAELRRGLPAPEQLSEADVRAYYESHRAEFSDQERRRVSVLAVTSRALAERLLPEASSVSPERWGELVHQHSVLGRKPATRDAERSDRPPLELAGDLGTVGPPGDPRGDNAQVPGGVRAAVFELAELGQVFPQVVSEGAYHYLVRLMGKTQARQRSLAEAERAIRVRLVELKLEQAEAELEARLAATIPVTINRQALEGVQLPSDAVGVKP